MTKIEPFIARILFFPIREDKSIGDTIEQVYNRLHLEDYELPYDESGYSQSIEIGNTITIFDKKYKVIEIGFQSYISNSNKGVLCYDDGNDKKYEPSEYNLTINVFVKSTD